MIQTTTAPINESILKDRQTQYDTLQGARVGDYLLLPYGLFTRFTHAWDDTIQTGGGQGGFYLGNGYISYSGGLDSGVKYSDIEQTSEVKEGLIWFFDKGISGADRGVDCNMNFRVFKLKADANTNGLPQIKRHEKKLIQDQAETITRLNGNGQEYTTPLPELIILADYLNDVYLANLNKQTGLNFIKSWNGSNCYACQPLTCKQFTTLLMCCNFETKHYNNSLYNNTMFLTFPKSK